MRFTKLSAEQIMKELNNPDDSYFPKSFLLREMGNLLLEGGEDAEQAEKYFRESLGSNDPERKLSAVSHLTVLEVWDDETYRKLEEFKNNFANKEILEEAGKDGELLI